MKQIDLASERIRLQHLKVFAAVARLGSMTKAARQLAVSQPVVSKTIADLERLLGVSLFDRSPQGVAPTFYGQALLRRCLGIFDDVRTSVEEIRFLSDRSAGELRIGCTEPLLAGVVTEAMQRIWKDHPRIALRTWQADGATLINRELAERRIELAVIPLIEPLHRDDLETTPLYRDFWHVVAGDRSPWVRRRKIELAELLDEPWCSTPYETAIGALLAAAFRDAGLAPPRLAVSSVLSPQLVARMLEDGRMIAVMSDSLLNFFYAKRLPVRKLPVTLVSKPFTVGIVTVRGRTISPVAHLFIEQARAAVRPLAMRSPRVADAKE